MTQTQLLFSQYCWRPRASCLPDMCPATETHPQTKQVTPSVHFPVATLALLTVFPGDSAGQHLAPCGLCHMAVLPSMKT